MQLQLNIIDCTDYKYTLLLRLSQMSNLTGMNKTEDFSYSLSSDELPDASAFFRVKIGALEGKRDSPTPLEMLNDPLLAHAEYITTINEINN